MLSATKMLIAALVGVAVSASGVVAQDWGRIPAEQLARTNLPRSRMATSRLMTTPADMASPRSDRRVGAGDRRTATASETSESWTVQVGSEPSLTDHILPGAVLRHVERVENAKVRYPASPSAGH